MPEPSKSALSKEREKVIVAGLVALMLIVWLGFPLHRSHRFAGSLWGGILGVTGGLLMLVPLVYMVVKRIPRLKKALTKHVRMRTFLTWHIYAGVLGPILVVIHSGHKYQSTLGIVLTGMTLLVVVSGFVGRYLMTGFSREIREKKKMLAELQVSFDRTVDELAQHPEAAKSVNSLTGMLTRLAAGTLATEVTAGSAAVGPSPLEAARLTGTMADLEYAIRTHETFKTLFGKWLKFHIVVSCFLYAVMFLHVYYAVYFGLRWLE